MRIRFIILFLSSVFIEAVAQDWTWMKGSNSANQLAVYGVKNIASPLVTPGARGGAMGWKDNAGNLFLFGGEGFGLSTNGRHNDLFKYTISTNDWTWINGDQVANQSGVYGTIGVSAPTNKPGSRSYAATWTDAGGNFWLFGGIGYDVLNNFGSLNDLWKYDPSLNEWTWMKGSNTVDQNGTYGTIGVSNNLNNPGARAFTGTWVDAAGDLWLFAGNGFATFNNNGALNDLWKFNVTSSQWTWVKGDSLINPGAVFGTKGVFSAANKPNGRPVTTTWMDASGNFWFFGGFDSGGPWDDLWKYDPTINQWAWMKGAGNIYQNGIYGTMNVPAPTNNPGSRSINIGWKDAAGDFWLLGGYGRGATTTNIGYLNDMWKYSLSSNDWVWQKGSSTVNDPGNYGTQGVSSPFNNPSARSNSTTWVDNNGDLWLFGSANWSTTYTNDLWKLSSPLITQITTNEEIRTRVFPNPATQFVFVQTSGKKQITYFLMDLNGKELQTGNITTDFHKIDLEKLSSGTYILKLLSDSEVITQKIVVSK